ncbi:3-hydroxyisobutyrate dehydrogenase [Pacificimonas flava]|uniref:3-hydroxyisobutyrate dehydrogenase n=2 Tax=Pacificimonas TaxID=1960290 RepID=A0A219B808_9SPHN|nr:MULTISPECIES: 3-hydroxyisobutyrate dehydrogenase [Pacificimonas]MBZ6378405.1 3-hydroxyisobutyrate dehydrogenase [Pacificimonas aurantium]OWV34293.1 3-hydroxyisobutyrate dehydrogenase [Pacificimonas flava]
MSIIAFIGLGNMGSGMAANLVSAGHDVRAFDLSAKAMEATEKTGCLKCGSAGEAVRGADAVLTMLPAGDHVAAVYETDVFDAAGKDAVLIDCSTIDVATARDVASAAAERGLAMVDAPVSGGIAAATGGTLTFMVGGPAPAFEKAEPLLAAMGKAVIHAGDAGAGQAAKICNNMLLGATMAATAETLVMAQKLGLDPQTFYDIASVSSGQSWSLTSYCPLPGVGPESPADRRYEGGFAAALMLKDLRLALEAARTADASVPMGALAGQLYQLLVNGGQGGRDFSSVIEMLGAETASR